MSHTPGPSFQDPDGMTGIYPCPSCKRDTTHTVLAIVNSRDFEADGVVQFLNHYLTVKCNGCGTVSFCHAWENTDEEDYDERGGLSLVRHKKHYPEVQVVPDETSEPFIDPSRLKELVTLPRTTYDTLRLAQMLAELDRAYRSNSFLSCALLLRAILDHVPPIFGLGSFAEVASNYAGGGKSFRESMQHLQNSARKIGDSHLHAQIRVKESVPTRTQVEFRADIDVLIGEIVRIMRPKP